jgi:uncharacterized protein (TIGR02246 family)
VHAPEQSSPGVIEHNEMTEDDPKRPGAIAQRSKYSRVVSAASPQDLQALFVARANAKDLAGLVDLYESDATFVGQDGARVVGTDAIRDRLAQLLSASPVFGEGVSNYEVVGRDIALLSYRWRAVLNPPGADALEISGTTTEVARRQPDGTWRYAIDAPVSVSGAPS